MATAVVDAPFSIIVDDVFMASAQAYRGAAGSVCCVVLGEYDILILIVGQGTRRCFAALHSFCC